MRFRVIFILVFSCYFGHANDETTIHRYSVMYCQMYVSDDYIIADLKIPMEDLFFFEYLKMDSTRMFTKEDVSGALLAYQKEIKSSFILTSEKGILHIDDIEMSFSMDSSVTISELVSTQISYLLQFKKEDDLSSISLLQEFGKTYPLIPSVMLIDINGTSVKHKQLELNKGRAVDYHLREMETLNKGHIMSIYTKDSLTYVDLTIPKNRSADIKNLNSQNAYLQSRYDGYFSIFKNGELYHQFVSNKRIVEREAITMRVAFIKEERAEYMIKWKKFDQRVRTVEGKASTSAETVKFKLSRFSDEFSIE